MASLGVGNILRSEVTGCHSKLREQSTKGGLAEGLQLPINPRLTTSDSKLSSGPLVYGLTWKFVRSVGSTL